MATRKTVAFESYTITRDENNKIIVTKNGEVQDNAKGALREIASKCGLEADNTWTTQQFGSKLIAYIEKNNSALDSYDYTEDAGNGLVYIKKGDKWGFANTDGLVLIEPKFDMLGDEFVDGMIVTGQNGLHGYVNSEGKEVVEPIYKNVTDFKNGAATVHLGDEEFKIDKNGSRLTSDTTKSEEETYSWEEGLAVVKIFLHLMSLKREVMSREDFEATIDDFYEKTGAHDDFYKSMLAFESNSMAIEDAVMHLRNMSPDLKRDASIKFSDVIDANPAGETIETITDYIKVCSLCDLELFGVYANEFLSEDDEEEEDE